MIALIIVLNILMPLLAITISTMLDNPRQERIVLNIGGYCIMLGLLLTSILITTKFFLS